MSAFTIDCTGDACTGDIIEFTEGVFSGSFRSPTFIGDRTVRARIIKDSYGSEKQQHTFTLDVLECIGTNPITPGKTTRKGRNVYRNGTMRQPWPCEADRQTAVDAKHKRGDQARSDRDQRRREGW
ncbi:hypothetical protein EUV02_15455 [Polymorphobacter arshaanensis]|uniref:DUF7699 domain-containing protein n=1 Tax=Glacieibacterium arshaanense TaxID=2511025 RepID=A0A4Y9EJJ3_9SPHN|nr:hypothetical protein [Polymorphobacter arshaanensis]TFU00042.1 hypothetical protein EUV02_15455 [Polymorphobacter arshaanensis]